MSMAQRRSDPPRVVTWFKVYCVTMAALFLFAFIMCFILLVSSYASAAPKADESMTVALFLLVMCVPLIVAYVSGLALAPKPWCVDPRSRSDLPGSDELLPHAVHDPSPHLLAEAGKQGVFRQSVM